MKHPWEDYELAADRCIATATQLAKVVEWDGLTLEQAIRLANVGVLPESLS